MRGHVLKRGKTWSYVIDLPRLEDEKRRQKWVGGFHTRKAAEAALLEARTRLQSGTYVMPTKQTVGEYLTKDWLPAIKATIRPSTYESYERNLRLHVIPNIGSMRLSVLDGGALNRLYGQLLANGNLRPPNEGLAPRTVHYIHTIIHRALRDAVRWDRLARNAADAADPPRQRQGGSAIKAWQADSLGQFLRAVQDDRLHGLWVLLATTGLRRGEALGARWCDLDLPAGTLAVRQTLIAISHRITLSEPKTAKGRRVVALDDATVAALKAHKARQAQERLPLGLGWDDTGLVFTQEDGQPLHPEYVSNAFSRRVRSLKLPSLSLHGLRHTWATLALQSGVHPKIVSERLGHANISITLNTYSHVTPTMQADAARTVARLLFGDSAG